MKWIALWFCLGSTAPLPNIPQRPTFDTEAACVKFAESRVGIVRLWMNQPVRYECRALPMIEPTP